jgi:hypothetical protein
MGGLGAVADIADMRKILAIAGNQTHLPACSQSFY